MQESSSRDLDERPASRFAAAFVGNANLIEAEVEQQHGDGLYTVALPGGLRLRSHASRPNWRPSGRRPACIRPENVEPAGQGFLQSWRAPMLPLRRSN